MEHIDKTDISRQIEYLLFRKGISKSKAAALMGMSPNNLYNKFARNSFSLDDLKLLCTKLDCTLEVSVTIEETGEKIYLIGD